MLNHTWKSVKIIVTSYSNKAFDFYSNVFMCSDRLLWIAIFKLKFAANFRESASILISCFFLYTYFKVWGLQKSFLESQLQTHCSILHWAHTQSAICLHKVFRKILKTNLDSKVWCYTLHAISLSATSLNAMKPLCSTYIFSQNIRLIDFISL